MEKGAKRAVIILIFFIAGLSVSLIKMDVHLDECEARAKKERRTAVITQEPDRITILLGDTKYICEVEDELR